MTAQKRHMSATRTAKTAFRLRTYLLATAAVGAITFGAITQVRANPTGPTSPAAVVSPPSYTGLGTTNLQVNLNQPRTIIDWSTYNIASGETTSYMFGANNNNWIVLNRVNAGSATINGTLQGCLADCSHFGGNIWIYASDGVVIGNNAVVNTGGFLATTSPLSMTDSAFATGTGNSFSFGAANPGTLGAGAVGREYHEFGRHARLHRAAGFDGSGLDDHRGQRHGQRALRCGHVVLAAVRAGCEQRFRSRHLRRAGSRNDGRLDVDDADQHPGRNESRKRLRRRGDAELRRQRDDLDRRHANGDAGDIRRRRHRSLRRWRHRRTAPAAAPSSGTSGTVNATVTGTLAADTQVALNATGSIDASGAVDHRQHNERQHDAHRFVLRRRRHQQ